eukprot:362235-Chlamydomonas_euryale.AAC.1
MVCPSRQRPARCSILLPYCAQHRHTLRPVTLTVTLTDEWVCSLGSQACKRDLSGNVVVVVVVVVVALHTPAGGIANECTQRKKSEKLNFVPTLAGPKSTAMRSPHRANQRPPLSPILRPPVLLPTMQHTKLP